MLQRFRGLTQDKKTKSTATEDVHFPAHLPFLPQVDQFALGALEVEFIRGSDMGGGVGGLLYSKRRNAAGTHLVASFNLSYGRGDVTAQADANGNVTWQATYEAFGMSGQHADSGQRSCTSPVASSGVSPIGMMHGFMLVKWRPFSPAPEG